MSVLPVDEALQREASADAEAVGSRAGVEMRELLEVDELRQLAALLDTIWRPEPTNPPVTTEILRALAKSGNYVVAAYDAEGILGACVGFFAEPRSLSMHSHIAAVTPRGRGRDVGYALKLHQRAWALQRGLRRVSWTFDPLIRRNAYFNIAKLCATPSEYLPDFYGEMEDAINRGDATDRLLVSWDLRSPLGRGSSATPGETWHIALDRASDGGPALSGDAAPGAAAAVRVAVPPDIEGMRHDDPGRARAWRSALREVLHGLMGAGMQVTGFDRAGWYELRRPGVEPAGPSIDLEVT